MHLDLLEQSVGLDSLREALGHLRAGGTQFEDFITRQLNDIDAWREELDRREQELSQLRGELMLERERLEQERVAWHEQQSQHDEQRLAQADQSQAVIAQLQADLAVAQESLAARSEEDGLAASVELAALESQLRQVESERDALLETGQPRYDSTANQEQLAEQATAFAEERDALQREMDDLRRQISRLAGGAMELVDARAELAEARGEILRYKELLQAGNGSDEGVQLQIRDLERERAALEMELDQMRQRVAELAEHASQERHRSAEERAEWSGELKQLRRVLESQSRMLADNQDAPPRPPRETVGAGAHEGRSAQPSNNPVLGSVMAQFEMLQKDLVRRRTNSTKPNPNRP